MTGMRRRQAPSWALSVLLLSALALFAFAFYPMLAQADSGEIQYSDAPPTPTGDKALPKQEPPARSSNSASNGGESAPSNMSESTDTKSSDDSSSVDDSASGSAGKGNDGGTGQSSREAKPQASSGPDAQAPTQPVQAVASDSDDEGSSPLVPILIAILALAAVSFGAMMVRHRRQRSKGAAATRVSPKAS